jgi:hypothetical protein
LWITNFAGYVFRALAPLDVQGRMGNLYGRDRLEPNVRRSKRLTGLQRLPTLAEGRRTHADWHQAVIGQCGLGSPERPLYEVVRSQASGDPKATRHRPLLPRLA